MKCIQMETEVKTINTMRHQTIYKWKGAAAAAGLGTPGAGGPAAAAVPFHLSMVWCLIALIVSTWSFDLYPFHSMLPLCIFRTFMGIYTISLYSIIAILVFLCWGHVCPPGAFGQQYWIWLFSKFKAMKKQEQIFVLEDSLEAGKIYVIDLAIKKNVQELASNSIRASSYGHFFPEIQTWSQCLIQFFLGQCFGVCIVCAGPNNNNNGRVPEGGPK